MAEGELDFSAPGKRSDEFGDLAIAFEEMTGALRGSRARLEERTSELANANDRLLSEVAERKQAEEAVRKARDELEKGVEERTAELVRTNQILKEEIEERERLEAQFLQAQKMEAIGQMAGGVAHDFNNLLTGIVGYSQLGMVKGCPRGRLSGYLQEIQNAAQRAAHLTRQLLAFSRQQIIEPRVLSINDLFLDLDKMLRRLIGEDVELVTLPAPDLVSCIQSTLAKAGHAGQDLVSGLGPYEGLGVFVGDVQVAVDGSLQFGAALMHAPAQLLFGEQT